MLLQRLERNVQRFSGGLVFKAHPLCVSFNSWLVSNEEGEEEVLVEWTGDVEVRARRILRVPL